MLSACLISLPPEALSRMMSSAAPSSSGGRRTERRLALCTAMAAMAVGLVCSLMG